MTGNAGDPNASTEQRPAGPAASALPPADLAPGTVLSDRFELGVQLGSGGMGSVYAAHDRISGTEVAIKVLLPELIKSEHAQLRFMTEAIVSRNLSHPNIVRVHDVGKSGVHTYFSMERLWGQTLRQRIAGKEPLSFAASMEIVQPVIVALQYAQRFVVHRDINPENIWIDRDHTIKLMDFGIVRALERAELTQTNMLLGTPRYMAPEQQVSAKGVDWRADQYSVGVILYEMLTGSVPLGVITPLGEARPDLPKRHADAVTRAMHARPEQRWPSWEAFLTELTAPARQPLPVAKIGLGVGAVAATVVALGLYLGRTQEQAPEVVEPQVSAVETAKPAEEPTDRTAAVWDSAPREEPEPTPVTVPTKAPAELSKEITFDDLVFPRPSSEPERKPRSLEERHQETALGKLPAVAATFTDKLKDGTTGPVMVAIPTGVFEMGSQSREELEQRKLFFFEEPNGNEQPAHLVAIQRFALGQTEVTFDEYDRFVDAENAVRGNARKRPEARWGRAKRPVSNVSWNDAMDYADWLSAQTGKKYRLPTEAEWEYAADNAGRLAVQSGKANFCGIGLPFTLLKGENPCLDRAQPVKSYTASAVGLYDMIGNVQEWVQDCYHSSYEGAPIDGTAWIDSSFPGLVDLPRLSNCRYRVLRGSDYAGNKSSIRPQYRSFALPTAVDASHGFRVALDLEPASAP